MLSEEQVRLMDSRIQRLYARLIEFDLHRKERTFPLTRANLVRKMQLKSSLEVAMPLLFWLLDGPLPNDLPKGHVLFDEYIASGERWLNEAYGKLSLPVSDSTQAQKPE